MRSVILLLVANLLKALPVSANTIHEGKVIKIADGDTLTILLDKQQLKIRLADIDCPDTRP